MSHKEYLPIKDYVIEHHKHILTKYNHNKLIKTGKFTSEIKQNILRRMFIDKHFEIKDYSYSFLEVGFCDDDCCEGCSVCDSENNKTIQELKCHPTKDEWIDIEGIGYGWIGITDNDNKNRNMVFNHIKSELEMCLVLIEKENADIEYFHFINYDENETPIETYYLTEGKDSTSFSIGDLAIRISKNDLDIWSF